VYWPNIGSSIVGSQKRLVFCPFPCGFWGDLAKNFTGSLFPHSPSLCQVLSKSVQFSRRYMISENVFNTHYNIGPVCLSPTTKRGYTHQVLGAVRCSAPVVTSSRSRDLPPSVPTSAATNWSFTRRRGRTGVPSKKHTQCLK